MPVTTGEEAGPQALIQQPNAGKMVRGFLNSNEFPKTFLFLHNKVSYFNILPKLWAVNPIQ